MLVGAFNQEKALGAFSVIVKTNCETDGALRNMLQSELIERCYNPDLITGQHQQQETC